MALENPCAVPGDVAAAEFDAVKAPHLVKGNQATSRIPLEFMDQWKPLDVIRVFVYYVVREVLDPDVMRQGLDGLIRNHVPILGARIKPTGKNGALEYHQPSTFGPNHQLFGWSTSKVLEGLDSCLGPLGSANMKDSITIGSDVNDLETNWIPSTWPMTPKSEKPDSPLVFAHLTQYNDSTVIALNVPHTVFDMGGLSSLMVAWMQVIRGEEPVPFLKLKPGTLDGPQNLPASEIHKHGHYRIVTRSEKVRVLAGFMPEFIAHPKEERHTTFFPTATVDAMRIRFNENLVAKHGPDVAKVTNGNILSAIHAKISCLHRKSDKMMTISEVMTLRGRHPALPKDKPYLHNAMGYASWRFPINRTTPLEDIAYYFRQAVDRGSDPQEIARGLTVRTEHFRQGRSAHVCEPFDTSFCMINWAGLWRGIDFSPAVRRSQGLADGSTASGAASPPDFIVLGNATQRGMPTRFNGFVFSKAEGGYWCDTTGSKRTMALFKEELKADPNLQKW